MKFELCSEAPPLLTASASLQVDVSYIEGRRLEREETYSQVLRFCDRMGLLLMDEREDDVRKIAVTGTAPDIEDMVEKFKNVRWRVTKVKAIQVKLRTLIAMQKNNPRRLAIPSDLEQTQRGFRPEDVFYLQPAPGETLQDLKEECMFLRRAS